MRKLALLVAATLCSGVAHAKLPSIRLSCPTGLAVHYDGNQHATINGQPATFTNVAQGAWTIKQGPVSIDITRNDDDSYLATYTGKHGANGICQVEKVAGDSVLPRGEDHTASRRATGNIPCAQHKGQPMGQCPFQVTREGQGTATVEVTHPGGKKRTIFFDKGKALTADLSQADGNMDFSASKKDGLYHINAGNERYEIPEAVIFGG